jgi:hypothetical protein
MTPPAGAGTPLAALPRASRGARRSAATPSLSAPCQRRPGAGWLPAVVVGVAALGLAALAPAPAAAQAALPELAVEAPPELRRYLARLEHVDRGRLAGAMALAGLAEPGPPIRVILAPEGSPMARRVPPWVSGYALGEVGTVVLFPSRVGAYPYDSLEELLQHEVAHVLVARAARGGEVPRWLHEGIAMTAGGAWGLGDSGRFGLSVARQGEVPLARLPELFARGGAAAGRAYAVSGGFVRFLLRRHGQGVTGEILGGVGDGLPFEEAFRRAAGESLRDAEEAFWRRQTFWHRWLPLLTSSTVLWIAVTLLALWAIRRRRRRDAEVAARWEREDALAAAAAVAAAGEAEEPDGGWLH